MTTARTTARPSRGAPAPDEPAPEADERRPPRRGGGRLITLPPWTRAPGLAFRHPAVVLAVIAAAAILACASASPVLFLSSASSQTLHLQIDSECADAAYPAITVQQIPNGADTPDAGRTVPSAMRSAGLGDAGDGMPYRTMLVESPVGISHGTSATQGKVFYGDGAREQVTMLSGGAGSGVLVPSSAATALGVGYGDEITYRGLQVRVAGIYQNLYDEPLRPYWCSYRSEFMNFESPDSNPPALLIATDPQTFRTMRTPLTTRSLDTFTVPIATEHLTASQAAKYADRRDRAIDRLSDLADAPGVLGVDPGGRLDPLAARTDLVTDGLRGPVLPIALGGSLLALLLVGAAGSYWADRRIREVRLLAARGVGPVGLAAKAGLELVIPAFAGAVLGWGLAVGLVRWLGPSADLDASAPWQAALVAGGTFLLGLALLGLVAGLRARSTVERPAGSRRSRLAYIPWELLLGAGAVFCWLRLRDVDAVVEVNGVAQVNMLVVAFPLLFLSGATVLVVRLLVGLLPLLRRRLTRLSPAWYLASSRICSSALISGILLGAVALPVAMTVYGAALTGTSETTLQAKARVAVGSEIAVLSLDDVEPTPALDDVATLVQRYEYVELGGQSVQLLAVDPSTFAAQAFWDDRFADLPLSDLLDRLARPAGDGPVPVAAVGLPGERSTLTLGDGPSARDMDVDVVARPTTFPGDRDNVPIVVIAQDNLRASGDVPRSAGRTNELWSTGSEADITAALSEQDARVWDVRDRDGVFRVANYQGVSWTFGYLQALAALAGAIAVGGILLYVETRQRSRVAAYAMARRMGLTRGGHFRSLLAELGVLLGVAAVAGAVLSWVCVLSVYHWLDIDVRRPPGPLLTVPTVTLVAAAAAAVLVAVLAALYAQRAADRTDLAEVLRLGS